MNAVGRSHSLKHILRLSNISVSVAANGKSAVVRFPTLSMEDIDRTGNINIVRIQRMMTLARMAAYHTKSPETGLTFLEYDKLTDNIYTFMGSSQTEVAPEFYRILHEPEFKGFDLKLELGHVGTSSLNSVCSLRLHGSDQLLARNVNTVVTVDRATRRPIKLADWWKTKYESAVVGNEKLRISPVSVPEGSHVYRMNVPWSDIDAYKHTNYLAYVRYCLDALMDGIAKERFPQFDGDLYLQRTKNMQLLFRDETKAGDNLDISVWTDSDNSHLVHFDIKRESSPIFQNSMEFYDPSSNT